MARHATIAERVKRLLGHHVVSTNPVAGGDICVAIRARLSDGRNVFVKTRAGAPSGFFAREASGLEWLAKTTPAGAGESGGVTTPEVLAYDEECLVLEWIEERRPSVEAAEQLGRALAITHQRGAPQFGADHDGFVGTLSAPNTPEPTWSEFYARARLQPYLHAARQRGALRPEDAAAVETVITHLDELTGPAEPPARLHGDLWSGNIIWAADGVPRLVDPAAYGGHREMDLAMLALFGAPHLNRVVAAYDEVYPLAEGWQDRTGLHQLHPLLVHATLFGGGYGARAGASARELVGSTPG